ncbi:hypothetical protein LAZ67_3000002 [Cordylochernes scorpioides]|uniref:Uncharacterized protein n=1 Tax=Cordylochernes scorpioides TaxID=51811 RepID=A0ABY6K5U6_9ARAC|nr:hypothetical protein LAZ67_3000002 [Cordylochernes scorpioides]
MFSFRDSPENEKCIQKSTIDINNLRRWIKRFRSGETSLDDKLRSGGPSTNPEDKVDDLIRHDRRITIREFITALLPYKDKITECIQYLCLKIAKMAGNTGACYIELPMRETGRLKMHTNYLQCLTLKHVEP